MLIVCNILILNLVAFEGQSTPFPTAYFSDIATAMSQPSGDVQYKHVALMISSQALLKTY